MTKKIIIAAIIVLVAVLSANAQSEYSRSGDVELDIRAGVAISQYQPQKKTFLTLELELNKKFTPYFTVAPSLLYNKSDNNNNSSLFQLNMNAFLSPFRNTRRNDFRVGGGVGYSFLHLGWESSRNSFGVNMIVENTYSINQRWFIGLKGFVQTLVNKDTHAGLILKTGVNF